MNKDNAGALFKNGRKETEKHPDYRGEVTVGGEEYYISAWLTKSKKGTTYMSLKLTGKDGARQQGMQQARQAVQSNFIDDKLEDVPF